jgi:hypothetical protein
MPGIQIKKHRTFNADYDELPDPVKERLNSFFRQVSFDPDDESILEICGHKDDKLAYPLGQGWIVYWRTLREKTQFTTLTPAKPLRVDLFGFHRFEEFERLKVDLKPRPR